MHPESTKGSITPTSKPERRYDIDWLRLGAVFLLFFFHSARVFDPTENFYVQNIPKSDVIFDIFIRTLSPWHMSLFFLLAGASTYYALRKRSGGDYTKERFKRLFIPFVFGVLVLIPPQSYIGLLNHSDYSGSFFHWFPDFFKLQEDDMEGYFMGGHTWGHLWFIIHLFLYSLIALPLFLYFNRESGRRLINKLASAFTHPSVLFLFPVLLVLFAGFPDIVGGNPLFYITFFICGFILMTDQRFGETIDRHRKILLILGPIITAGLVTAYSFESWAEDFPDWFDDLTDIYFDGFVAWFVILTLLAYGKRFLNFTNRFLKYFAEASYPLYILHQTLIILIAYYLVQTDMVVAAKYVVLVASAFASTLLVYHVLVKRNRVTRFLFGMKPRAKKTPSKSDSSS